MDMYIYEGQSKSFIAKYEGVIVYSCNAKSEMPMSTS